MDRVRPNLDSGGLSAILGLRADSAGGTKLITSCSPYFRYSVYKQWCHDLQRFR